MRPLSLRSRDRARALWTGVSALALLGSPAVALTGGAGEIVEEFTDTIFLDRLSTALWAFNGSGRLVAGSGVGGNGSDGVFVAVGTEGVLDTSANRGVFNFSRFAVPAGTRVRFAGPNSARVRVLLRADV